MKKIFIQTLSFGIVLLFYASCIKDNSLETLNQKDFFQHTNSQLDAIVTSLQEVEIKEPFITKFKEEYGIPLWDYSDIIADEEQVCYFVPIYHSDSPRTINTIWFFLQKNEIVTKVIIQRGNHPILIQYEQEFMFDYLAYCIWGKDNSSGLIFKSTAETRTMTAVTTLECTDAYVDVGGYSTYKGTTCKEVTIWVDLANNFASNRFDDAGGGGSGNTISTAPLAQSIFRNSSMTEENWETVEKMIEKIKLNCMGDALYNGLKTLLAGKTIVIQFTNGVSSFSYDGTSAIISLNTSMESNQLFHEMWHAYQAYQETNNSFQNSLMNQEIEAHYAQYLYMKDLVEYSGSKWKKGYERNPRLNAVARLEHYINEKGQLKSGISGTDLNAYINYMVGIFDIYGYNTDIYKFNSGRTSTENFSNLTTITKDC